MSAEELRRQRDAEQQARRIRLSWVAALGGRTGLAAPLTRQRMVGGVQSPSVGTVSDLGEIVPFHMRGSLVADVSDPYTCVRGGAPMLQFGATSEPSGAELDVLRNGAVVDTISIVFTSGYMEYQVEDVYVRGDQYVLDLTDPGTGGSGLVVTTEFRPSLS